MILIKSWEKRGEPLRYSLCYLSLDWGLSVISILFFVSDENFRIFSSLYYWLVICSLLHIWIDQFRKNPALAQVDSCWVVLARSGSAIGSQETGAECSAGEGLAGHYRCSWVGGRAPRVNPSHCASIGPCAHNCSHWNGKCSCNVCRGAESDIPHSGNGVGRHAPESEAPIVGTST